MITVKYPAALAAVFLWIGFVCAISFMEAWLKFRAPGITVPLGLGIGRLVFHALNKMEWIFAIVIAINMLFAGYTPKWSHLFFVLPLLLLAIQTAWLLPVLDARAEMHIQGLEVPPSNKHFIYVAMEALKVIALLIFGLTLFKHTTP